MSRLSGCVSRGVLGIRRATSSAPILLHILAGGVSAAVASYRGQVAETGTVWG